jgi:hypothetical protein
VLRRKFLLKRKEVTGGWRKLHNEELYNVCSSSNIVRMIKTKKMRWAKWLSHMGQKKNA